MSLFSQHQLSLTLAQVLLAWALLHQTSVFAQEDRQTLVDQIEQVDDALLSVSDDLTKTQSEAQAISAQIESIERSMNQLQASIQREQLALQDHEQALEVTLAQINSAQATLQDQQDAIGELLRALWLTRDNNRVKLLLSQEDPASLARYLVFNAQLAEHQTALLTELKQVLSKLDTAEQTQRQLQAKRASSLNALRQQREALAKEQSDRTDLLQSLASLEQSLLSQQQALQQDRASLQTLIDEIDITRSQAGRNKVPPITDYQKSLNWPTSAAIKHRYNSVRNNELRWQGVLFNNALNDPVTSIYHGQVVFADWLRGYGLLVIIDHGDDYMSLYAHNNALLVAEGDWVDTGTAIAQAGNTGGQTQPGLYFEIRQRGIPQNPAQWCR